MFLCLHAAGFNLIPVGVIAVRASLKASNPTDIFIPSMIVTFVATMAAMAMVSARQRINIFKPVVIGWVLGVSALMVDAHAGLSGKLRAASHCAAGSARRLANRWFALLTLRY